jgi:hypothetical protein
MCSPKKIGGKTTALHDAALTARVIIKSESEMFYLRVLAVLHIIHSHIAERIEQINMIMRQCCQLEEMK